MNIKRVFLVVLDSFGVGELPDAKDFGDEGSNTLKAVSTSKKFYVPNMKSLGLFNIDSIGVDNRAEKPLGAYGKAVEKSKGKDTTTGHWEMAGVISERAMPTFPNGFPDYIIKAFEERTGRKVICNKPYSGTQVIMDYGQEHLETGALICYTSADSVFQIAAHESIVPVEQLYEYCKIARKILTGDCAVGRVIARPFEGEYPDFKRTSRRHDFSLEPTGTTMLDILSSEGYDVIGVGKINDIFASRGITDNRGINKNNSDGMNKTFKVQSEDFHGICFVNLVDFDMLYGHRNDVEGYANALTVFDKELGEFLPKMRDEDILIITADHGCDPSTPSTDHSREHIPVLVYGKNIKENVNLGTLPAFADISATVLDFLDAKGKTSGDSFKNKVMKNE